MTIYEVISNYDCIEFCGLLIGMVSMTFTKDEVRSSNVEASTIIGNVNIRDNLKFEFNKETDDWIHFNDCNNLGYRLSIKKAAEWRNAT